MEYREAIHSLKPTAIITVKIAGEAIVRTIMYFVLFIAVLIILKLYDNNYYMIYIGFAMGSLIANTSYVFNKRRITQHQTGAKL